MTSESLSVSDVLSRAQQAIVGEFPSPVWVRGEVTGLRRTSGGAAFFRLADSEIPEAALEVAARGRVMMEVDRMLDEAGLGSLRDGIEVRVEGTLGVASRGSAIRLSLLKVDPSFTAGRMALDRDDLIRRLESDGSLNANGRLPIPLVPLRIGLVTSRGSAAHADFTDQLRRSGLRFRVLTAHTTVQGEGAAGSVAAALMRSAEENVDMIVLTRGGGSKLDLAVFDAEPVARAIARLPVPVITGIGHDIDTTVADLASAIAQKTPTAAGEWLVARVQDYANRIDTARRTIRAEARAAMGRHQQLLRHAAADVAGSVNTLRRQHDVLDRLRFDIAQAGRETLSRNHRTLEALADWFTAIDVEPTLKRGFAILTDEPSGRVIRSVSQVSPGDRLSARLGDGTVRVIVSEE